MWNFGGRIFLPNTSTRLKEVAIGVIDPNPNRSVKEQGLNQAHKFPL
jgi:hypothetical protein